jgi:hypothetical protein
VVSNVKDDEVDTLCRIEERSEAFCAAGGDDASAYLGVRRLAAAFTK